MIIVALRPSHRTLLTVQQFRKNYLSCETGLIVNQDQPVGRSKSDAPLVSGESSAFNEPAKKRDKGEYRGEKSYSDMECQAN